MRGFGAATLTEQYRPPSGPALCTINDPPPLAVTDPVQIGNPSVLRSFSVEFTAAYEITKASPFGCLFSTYASSASYIMLYVGGGTTGTFPDSTLVVFFSASGEGGSFAINDDIPAGQHSLTFSSVEGDNDREIWLDAVQKTALTYGTAQDSLWNSYATAGARASDETANPVYVEDSLTDHRVHRIRASQGKYTPAQIAEFASGGFPTTAFDYEMPCTP